MEAPPVRYATTSDGVSIAWAEAGRGPAILWCNGTPFSHVQEIFTVFGQQFEAIVRSFRLVTFDARGSGMSERDVEVVSTETLLTDAEAVIDAARLDSFIAYADAGNMLAVATCLRLAIDFPERVTHVVLESPFVNMQEIADTPFGRVGSALAELDWTVFLQTLCRVLLGLDESSEVVQSLARAIDRWVGPRIGRQYMRVFEKTDLSDLLPQVRQPTLVMRQEPYVIPARCVQRVAARISGAEFRQYSDPTYAQVATIICDFIDQREPRRAEAGQSPFRAVLFTDIVGHTEMMQRLGDARGREVLREHERITRETLKQHGGTEIKAMGDGFMASFGSVTRGMECAVALQRRSRRGTQRRAELKLRGYGCALG